MKLKFSNPFRKNQLLNAILIGLLSVSCTVNIPRSYIQYIDQETKQTKLSPVITDETDEYKLAVEPLGNVDDYLIFNVDLTNKNLDTLYIDPREWQLLFSESKYFYDSIPVDSLRPLTPAEASLVYANLANKLQAAEDGKEAAIIIIGVVLIVGVIVLAVALAGEDDEDDDSDYAYEGSDNNFNFSFNVLSSSDITPIRDRNMNPIQSEILYYKDMSREIKPQVQEKMFLQRGEFVNFDLYFKRMENMRTLKLQGGFNDQLFEWDFNHIMVAPTADTPR
ncbi:MAG: hypothetical protein ACI8TA_001529 [Cyclobacteriaceae bacterium]|jgi:hypothetical protein